MNVETIELSTCCDAKVVVEIYEGYNEHDHWGICADCSEWTVFATDLTDWPTSDVDESIEELQTPFTGATQALNNISDSERLRYIGTNCNLPTSIVDNFQPKVISWVTPRIGITSRDGVRQALEDGCFVINTAEEINNEAHIKIGVDGGSGKVLRQLNQIKDVMTNVLATTDQKVVVHCAMGMERSVLSVVWFMANTWGMDLGNALAKVQEKRPIALNRLVWITM